MVVWVAMVVAPSAVRTHLRLIEVQLTWRYVAKNIVAATAERAEVQLAYAIGVAEPVSVYVETFGTAKIPETQISELVRENFPMKRSIINIFSSSVPCSNARPPMDT